MARVCRRRLHCRLLDHRPAIVSEGCRRGRRDQATLQASDEVAQQTDSARRQQERPGARKGYRQRRSATRSTGETVYFAIACRQSPAGSEL